jgi:hypothetical protein
VCVGNSIVQQHQYILPSFWDHKADDIIPEAIYIDVSKFLRGAVYVISHFLHSISFLIWMNDGLINIDSIRASDLLRGSFPQVPKAISLAGRHKNHILFSVRRFVRDKG